MPTGLVDLAQHFRFAEGRFGVKEPRLGGRDRNADLRCRFLQRMVLERMKLKSPPSPRTYTRNCVSKKSFPLSLSILSFGSWGRVRYFPQRLVYTWTLCRKFIRIAPLSKDHQRGIDPNTCQPGREGGSSVEALQMEKCP